VQVTTGELQVRVEGPELRWEIRDSNAGLVETRLDGLFAKLPGARLRAANARRLFFAPPKSGSARRPSELSSSSRSVGSSSRVSWLGGGRPAT
jgi:hypothetical protein